MQSQCKPGITACTTYSRPRFQHSTQKKRGRNEKGKGKGKGKARSATNVTVQHSQNNAMQPLQGSTCIKQQAVHPFGYRHSILKNTTKGEKEKCRATLHGSTHIKDNAVQPCLSSTLVNDAVQPLSGSTHIKDNAVHLYRVHTRKTMPCNPYKVQHASNNKQCTSRVSALYTKEKQPKKENKRGK